MVTSEIINLILTGVTIAIAIIALLQSNKQISLSNKQCLFKDRARDYVKFNGLVQLYKNNKKIVEQFAITNPYFVFQILTKDEIFEDDNFFEGKPLSPKEQKVFFGLMDDLETLATEISLLWESNISDLAKKFVYAYFFLLESLFRHNISITTKGKNNGYYEPVLKILTPNKLPDSIKQIELIYIELENQNILKQMFEQIKLK